MPFFNTVQIMKKDKRVSIQIFDIVLNGSDAERFCALGIADKIDWVKANTRVQDDTKIRAYLSLPPKPASGCGGCFGIPERTATPVIQPEPIVEPEVETESIDEAEFEDNSVEIPQAEIAPEVIAKPKAQKRKKRK
jgi:hypothetical protein